MKYIMIFLVVSVLTYLILNTIKYRKKIQVFTYLTTGKKISILISIVLFFMLAFFIGKDKIPLYLFSFLTSLLFILVIKTEGLGEKEIIYYVPGKGINNIKTLSYKDLEQLQILSLGDKIILNYKKASTYDQLVFSIKDKEQILCLLDKYKIEYIGNIGK